MVLLMIKHQSQVGCQEPNNIGRGIACKMVKNWMISLPEFTNDLGTGGTRRNLQYPDVLILA